MAHKSYVEVHNLSEVEVGDLRGIGGFRTRHEVRHIWKPVDDYHDRVMSSCVARKSQNEIHADIIPRAGQHWKWRLESSILLYVLGECAHSTLSYDVPYIALEGQPVELILDRRNGLITAKMTG